MNNQEDSFTLPEVLSKEIYYLQALFIISAEVLSRDLNAIMQDENYKGFGMTKWSDKINHLAYVDDTIIFTFADSTSLNMITSTLHEYEWIFI